jgi:hypothetical protein
MCTTISTPRAMELNKVHVMVSVTSTAGFMYVLSFYLSKFTVWLNLVFFKNETEM